MNQDELRTRIRNRLQEMQLSAITAATEVGLERTYIRDFVIGKKASLRLDKQDLVAKALGWTVGELMGLEPHRDLKPSNLLAAREQDLIPGSMLVGARDFPIFASTQGGDGAMIVHTDVMEYVKRPVILEGVPDAYGVMVVGGSMIPAYREGDMALVHPRRPPERETDSVFYDHDPRTGDAKSIIKRLVSFNDRSWKLEQYNPAKIFTEHRADWPICHQVVGKYNAR
jgi:SOS-response transcriptional repressor LexA